MTAITLNLLAEEQMAQEADARDPVKTTVAIGAVLLAVTALSGSVLWVLAGQKRTEANVLQTRLDGLSSLPELSSWAEFQAIKKRAQELIAVNHSRTLYAPQLALIKDLVPDSIQITRLNFALAKDISEAMPAPEDEDGNKAKTKRLPKPRGVEFLSLQLEGEAISSRPEIEVDAFIQKLRASAAFSNAVKRIQLRSIARSATSGDAAVSEVPSAHFVIDCQYKEQK